MRKPLRRSVLLTGFMGAGKSTVGPALAEQAGVAFVDLDQEIERHLGKQIGAVFSDHGEPYFRAIERELLVRCCGGPVCVVGLGGGTLLSPENRETVRGAGILVYLEATLPTLWQRSLGGGRPLLEGKREPDAGVHALFRARQRGYLSAELRVATDGRTIDEVVNAILGELP